MNNEKDLPEGWEWTTLEDFCTIIMGQSPPSSEYNEDGNGLPFFQGKAEFTDLFPVVRKWCTFPTKIAQKNDILLSVRAPVGPTNLAPSQCSIGRGLAAIRPEDNINTRYVLYAIRSFNSHLTKLATGTTFAAISGDDVRTFEMPLAPLPEQHHIVSVLEEQFTRLDAAVASLQQDKARLKQARASVFKAAVEGTLTEVWRTAHADIEPAKQLLERILLERREKWEADQLAKMQEKGITPKDDKWKERYEEPIVPDVEELSELPEGWCWATVEQVTYFVRYGSSAKTSDNSSGVPVLRMGNIQEGEIDISRLKYLPKDHSEFPSLLLEKGDLLFNRTNSAELVGKSAVYRGEFAQCSYASYLICIRMLSECLPDYICYYLNSLYGKEWIASVLTQQAGQANVNGSKLQALPFPLPPFVEQTQIVAEVEARLSVITQAEITVETSLKRAERTRQSFLQKAFSGQLVPQNPDDEPASVLLEHIHIEREQRELEEQQRKKEERMNRPRVIRKTNSGKEQKTLVEVLHEEQRPLTPADLFRKAELDQDNVEDVQSFHVELLDEVVHESIRLVPTQEVEPGELLEAVDQ